MGLGFRIKAQQWSSRVVSPGWWCPECGCVLTNSSPWGAAAGLCVPGLFLADRLCEPDLFQEIRVELCIWKPWCASWFLCQRTVPDLLVFSSRNMRCLTFVIPAVFCVKPEPQALAGVKHWEVRLKIWAFYWLSRISAEIFAQRKILLSKESLLKVALAK